MTVRKLSVALDDEVAALAAAAAERRGQSLSAWLNEAATHALAVEDGLAAVVEWEAEHGSFTDEELAVADAVLDRATGSRRRRRTA
jgi:predicted transcriptional regulator